MTEGMIISTDPPDLFQRFQRYPQQFNRVMEKSMDASMLHVQSSVPSYPPPREGQSYIRTGTLGRTMGISQQGQPLGKPSIYKTSKLGNAYQGEFGTNIHYAPDVIGEGTQKPLFVSRWWTIGTVARRAARGILRIHEIAVEELARWIDGY